jgi:hypothetical protein
MRCYICDVELSEQEISLDKELKSNPCTSCMLIINETAYSDGFEPDDNKLVEMNEEEIMNE